VSRDLHFNSGEILQSPRAHLSVRCLSKGKREQDKKIECFGGRGLGIQGCSLKNKSAGVDWHAVPG
jgi:hypothetical protein